LFFHVASYERANGRTVAETALLSNLWFALALFVALSAIDGFANAHRQSWGDWLAAAFFALYGGYCVQNFIRCREVHCAVTGPGFLIAALLMLLRVAGVGHYEYTLPWIVVVASACTGYCVQWALHRSH
jgi:FtsH-binding integral membrane protein